MAAMLVLVTVALYWPATSHDFVNYDDDPYVTGNAHVHKRIDLGKPGMGLLEPCGRQLASHNGVVPHAGLPTVRFEALGTSPDQRAAARRSTPGWSFCCCSGLTGAVWRSVWVAAVFGWHPLHVESVAWVSERKDVLSAFFGLLALMAYARYAQAGRQSAECRMQKADGRVEVETGVQGSVQPSSALLHSSFCLLSLSPCFSSPSA